MLQKAKGNCLVRAPNIPKTLTHTNTLTNMAHGRQSLVSHCNLANNSESPERQADFKLLKKWPILKLHSASLPYTPRLSQRQVAEKNLKEGEKREGRRSGSKTCDCHRKKKKEKNAAYSGDILCGAGICLVLTNADMLGTHTHTHTETPTGLKIGQKNISLLE